MQTRIILSIPLPCYPFSSTFHAQVTALYIPQKSTHMHDYKWNLHIHIICVYGADIYFYSIISVKLMIILSLPIYIFFNMNMLRTQVFNLIPRDRTITQIYLIIWFKLFYYGFFYERLIFIYIKTCVCNKKPNISGKKYYYH